MTRAVLITGAGGFIGSHLTERCVELGYRVKAFVHYNSRNHWGWLDQSKFREEIEIIAGDIRDFDSVFRGSENVDSIFHLAALIGIPYSYVSPLAYIKTNVEGTYNILEAARLHGTENVLITSTSETYGTAQYVPIDEHHPLVGQSPYAATKIAADQLAMSYFSAFQLPVRIVRPFNTYGPRQSARAIIPSVIIQVLAGTKRIKLGNTSTTRDFTFVADTVEGFIEVSASQQLIGQVTNLGTNREISIRDLATVIAGRMDAQIEVEAEEQRMRPPLSEVQRLCCDNNKVLATTHWKPTLSLEEGLDRTIEWYKANLQCYKSDIYNI